MKLDNMLREMLRNLFTRKNINLLVIGIIIGVISILMTGNYNLVMREGLTQNEELQQQLQNSSDAKKKSQNYEDIADIYEGMANSNHNCIGTEGNLCNKVVNNMRNVVAESKGKNNL
tara:strand:+ start:4011 stop:4361 length:351 start_codon:yes stop_codon:yes gene_type:complete